MTHVIIIKCEENWHELVIYIYRKRKCQLNRGVKTEQTKRVIT